MRPFSGVKRYEKPKQVETMGNEVNARLSSLLVPKNEKLIPFVMVKQFRRGSRSSHYYYYFPYYGNSFVLTSLSANESWGRTPQWTFYARVSRRGIFFFL